MNLIKSMLVGIALAAAMAVTPVLAADESADDSHALSQRSQRAVQEHTDPVPMSTEQLDSVSGGAAAAAAAAASGGFFGGSAAAAAAAAAP